MNQIETIVCFIKTFIKHLTSLFQLKTKFTTSKFFGNILNTIHKRKKTKNTKRRMFQPTMPQRWIFRNLSLVGLCNFHILIKMHILPFFTESNQGPPKMVLENTQCISEYRKQSICYYNFAIDNKVQFQFCTNKILYNVIRLDKTSDPHLVASTWILSTKLMGRDTKSSNCMRVHTGHMVWCTGVEFKSTRLLIIVQSIRKIYMLLLSRSWDNETHCSAVKLGIPGDAGAACATLNLNGCALPLPLAFWKDLVPRLLLAPCPAWFFSVHHSGKPMIFQHSFSWHVRPQWEHTTLRSRHAITSTTSPTFEESPPVIELLTPCSVFAINPTTSCICLVRNEFCNARVLENG